MFRVQRKVKWHGSRASETSSSSVSSAWKAQTMRFSPRVGIGMWSAVHWASSLTSYSALVAPRTCAETRGLEVVRSSRHVYSAGKQYQYARIRAVRVRADMAHVLMLKEPMHEVCQHCLRRGAALPHLSPADREVSWMSRTNKSPARPASPCSLQRI